MSPEQTGPGAEHAGPVDETDGPHPSARSSGRGSRQLVVSGMWRTTTCVVAQLALYWASVQYAW